MILGTILGLAGSALALFLLAIVAIGLVVGAFIFGIWLLVLAIKIFILFLVIVLAIDFFWWLVTLVF